MSEADAIERAGERGPATSESLAADLRELGVRAGDTLLVHTSLSRLGWVAGGPVALIDALGAAVGEGGTISMVAASTTLTDPANWSNPPVPEAWWETIRRSLPPFDPATTPVTHLGATPEVFRSRPGVLRSDHPTGSFCARGPNAASIVARHPLEDMLGDGSPLGRLYELGASILLLGVGHDNNTSLHLAESRVGVKTRKTGSPVLRDGRRVWVEYQEGLHDSGGFPEIAAAYEASGGPIRNGRVGSGEATLAPMREMVDFATTWLADQAGSAV